MEAAELVEEGGSRSAILWLAVPQAKKRLNSPLEDQHWVLWSGNQQLPNHHFADAGPIMIPAGGLTKQQWHKRTLHADT